VAEVV